MVAIEGGTQIRADGQRYPIGEGPADAETYNGGSVRVAGAIEDGQVPVWDEALGQWVPGTPSGDGVGISMGQLTAAVEEVQTELEGQIAAVGADVSALGTAMVGMNRTWVWDEIEEEYVLAEGTANTFYGPTDPETVGHTMGDGDSWETLD